MGPKKRFQLNSDIKTGAAPQIEINPEGQNTYRLTFSILVNGKDLPFPELGNNDPEKTTHRDIFTGQQLFLGNHSVKLESTDGVPSSTLTLKATVDGKVPGTMGLQ